MAHISTEALHTFLTENKLNFEVGMMPQYIKVHPTDDQGQLVTDLSKELLTGYCPVRLDTMTPLSLGGLSKDFHPIQNRDAFSIIPALSNVRDMTLVKGNMWGGGAGVYAQISLGGMQIGNGNDRVGKYLSVVNSHDGSKAMRILITPYRFYCKNQIAPAISKATEGATMITIHHNASADQKLEELINRMKIVDEVFQNTEEVYNDLASKRITADYVEEVISRMYPRLSHDATVRQQNARKAKIDATLDRFNFADGMRDDARFADIQQDPNVFNAWNLYNAVQGTIQHDSRNTASKEKSIIMGDIANRSASALSLVMEVCSSQHLPESIMNEIDDMTA